MDPSESELERLIAEQSADDTYFARPEQQNVSLETVSEYVGISDTYFAGTDDEHYSYGDEHQGVYSFLTPERGSVLVEGASWHGTDHGYTRKKCRCDRCKTAHKEAQRAWRAKRRGDV